MRQDDDESSILCEASNASREKDFTRQLRYMQSAECVSKRNNGNSRDYSLYVTIRQKICEEFYATKCTVYATIVLKSAVASANERCDNYGGNDAQRIFIGDHGKALNSSSKMTIKQKICEQFYATKRTVYAAIVRKSAAVLGNRTMRT